MKGTGDCSQRPMLASESAVSARDLLGPAAIASDEELLHTDFSLLEGHVSQEEIAEMEARFWKEPDRADHVFASQTARELDVHMVTALRLEKENFESDDYSLQRAFLQPGREHIRSPEETCPGMEAGAADLLEEMRAGKRLAVFADYDVDGTTSAAVIHDSLQRIGVEDQAMFHVARAGESFGLNESFVRRAHDEGYDLLMTVDNGSSSTSEIALAKELGMKTWVIDHHNIDTSNPADHMLNPRFAQAVEQAKMDVRTQSARELLTGAEQAKDNWLAAKTAGGPLDEELKNTVDDYKTRAHATMKELDGLVDDGKKSSRLAVAIERAENHTWGAEDGNTGAQLSWKFSQALVNADGQDDDALYGKPLYLASAGALADMGDMRDIENRAFVRLSSTSDSFIPPGLAMVSKNFDEDPRDPGSLMRTRGAFNLAKRTTRMDGQVVFEALTAPDEKTAKKPVARLLKEYDKAKAMRDVIAVDVDKDWARRKADAPSEPLVVSAVVTGYPEDVGQAGVIASQMVKKEGIPAFIAMEAGKDADGNTLLKVSGRGTGKSKLGRLLAVDPRTKKLKNTKLAEACTFETINSQGERVTETSLGGHSDVVSGMCRADRYDDFVASVQDLGEKTLRSEKWGWRKRSSSAVWVSKRLVPASDISRLEKEAALFKPTTNRNFPIRISARTRFVDVGEFNADAKTAPATIVFADGSTRSAKIDEKALGGARSGAWFETALSIGDRSYWVRDFCPLKAS